MKAQITEFKKFMQQRRDAAAAYVNGEIAPLRALTTKTSPATFFGPGGGTIEGAKKVFSDYERGAGMFQPGSTSQLKILQMEAGNGIAFWSGLQRANVRMKGKKQPVPMELRITEVFREENGQWMLVHRHADMLAKPQGKK